MTLWVDAMLSPSLARWLSSEFDGVDAFSADRLGLRDAKDSVIFDAARSAGAVVLTKDQDFLDEVEQRGTPQVVLVRSGNLPTRELKPILRRELPAALEAIRRGATVVEIGTPPSSS